MGFQTVYREKVDYINQGLAFLLSQRESHPTILDAIRYSLQAGGKRLRPILFLSAYELALGDCSKAQPPTLKQDPILSMSCAIEMIHTYSLIHDDLPAMDNDDYRRGKLTNHKVYGEATAILAGDGLLNLAYEVMLESLPADPNKQFGYLKAMKVIAHSAGISGMIGGQSADIENQGVNSDESMLSFIHTHKTEALITGALKAGVLACREDKEVLEAVSGYGKAFGLAFQITDDILDLMGDLNQLGKAPGSDERKGKLTYPAKYGLKKSQIMASQYIEEAVSLLQPFGSKSEFLISLAESILVRNR
ncbi:MAG: polyprenyl synthetase family protein [Caldicoprobacterales bacterium]|jgi:geranylgeranyl diphosphate synthase type II|nr:polyprenyl synthetase family protein [Clostridiales bacterium]